MGYALFWGVLYGLLNAVSWRLGWTVTAFAMLGYAVALVLWLGKKRWLAHLRLCLPTMRLPRSYLHLLPLLFFMIVHVAEQGGWSPPSLTLVLMAGTVVTEEILFRGVLLRIFDGLPPSARIILSAVIFSLFHLVNAIGQTDLLFVLYSLLYALAAGVLYAATTLYFESLIPAAVGHYLANVTAPMQGEHPSPIFLLVMAVCMLWGILLCRVLKRGAKGE